MQFRRTRLGRPLCGAILRVAAAAFAATAGSASAQPVAAPLTYDVLPVGPGGAPVFAIEVEAGDLIRVPRGTHHWFDLCAEKRIRAIRLFQDPAGWTPHYTNSGVDRGFQPICFGPAYVGPVPSQT